MHLLRKMPMAKVVVYENATNTPKLVIYKVGEQSILRKTVEPKGVIKLPRDILFELISTETIN